MRRSPVEARERMKLRHAAAVAGARDGALCDTSRAGGGDPGARDPARRRAGGVPRHLLGWMAAQPLSAQVKKGLAAAFTKFDEYALAKYDRAGAVRLRDVLFLSHAKPRDAEQAALWKRLIEGELATPDTWEVALSLPARDKRELLGAFAGRAQAGRAGFAAQPSQHEGCRRCRGPGAGALSATMKTDRVCSRSAFLAAARYAPQWEGAAGAGDVSLASQGRENAGRARRCCWSTSQVPWWLRSPGARRCCARMRRTVWRCCCGRSRRR